MIEGVDVAQLRDLAKQLAGSADRLESMSGNLRSLVNGNTQWRGADAERFRSEWNGVSVGVLKTVVDSLREADKVLRRNADEQDNASNGKRAGAEEMLRRLENDHKDDYGVELNASEDNPNGDVDGVRIERVVGPDGETRLIVYLKGQGAVASRSDLRSAGLAMGIVGVDASITRQIDEALAKLPDGKKSEVMLVGLSQGGMDAQNIASSGYYNVTTLMTYGTPIIQADSPNIATAHIRAEGDPVPVAGEAAAATARAATNPWSLIPAARPIVLVAEAVAPRSDNVFTHDTPNDGQWGSVHGNGYPGAAAAFDDPKNSKFDDVKQNMKKFEGTVTVVTE